MMKLVTISLLVILLAASGLLMGCIPADNPFPYISGSVTVPAVGDWTNLRLGVFYDSTGDFYTKYETGQTDYIYRAIYVLADDGTTVYSFTPQATATTAISQTSGVNGTFRVDFDPAGSTVSGDYYYPIAWIDDDADGLLDLIDDSSDLGQIAGSEFNRMPWYNTDGISTMRFYRDADYGYKFDGYSTLMVALDDIDRTAFSFNMTPTAANGW
jgi:hypothetical protein